MRFGPACDSLQPSLCRVLMLIVHRGSASVIRMKLVPWRPAFPIMPLATTQKIFSRPRIQLRIQIKRRKYRGGDLLLLLCLSLSPGLYISQFPLSIEHATQSHPPACGTTVHHGSSARAGSTSRGYHGWPLQ